MLPSSPHRMSPYRRQDLLVKRLMLTQRQRIHATLTASASKPAFAPTKTIASETVTSTRKRPFATITAPDSAKSPSTPHKIKSDPSVRDDKRNLRVRDGDLTNVDIIDENETWAEVSKIIPSLPYGEESNELLLVLLGLDYSNVGGNDNHSGATNIEDESISQSQSQYYALSNLARALERMLQTQNAPRQGRQRNSDKSLKQKPINEEHPQVMTERTSTEILPWNVLLRITIRMVSFVANKLLQSSLTKNESAFLITSWTRSAKSPNVKCNNNSQLDIGGDDTTRVQTSVISSILQVMDIAITNLRVLSRMRSQQRQENYSSKSTEETNDQTTPMAYKLPGQIIQRKQLLPIDRMFRDWKSHINMQMSVGRDVWGSSRCIVLKDIELIAKMMVDDVTIENDERAEGSRMSVDVKELNERVVVLITSLDECIRAEDGCHHEQNQLHQAQTQLGISPSMLRKGTKICSPSKSPSIASVTRTHVERVGSRVISDRYSGRKGSIMTFNLHYLDSNVISVNLNTVLDKESSTPEVADEMEEAYRIAMAVGSSRRGDNVREAIERRLEILVQKHKDDENRDTNRDTGLNIDGAGAYLESLLRTLIQPSDPNVWMRLLEESGEKETPIMLRRGRTLLISFLIGIHAPGWKDASHRLEPSPVPSYLGYLCSRDDLEASKASESMQQHTMMNRLSYFLPAVERGQMILPPSPIVTEVGLSLCMKNFLQKDTPERLDDSSSYQPYSSCSPGANLFRKYVPLHFSESSRDRLLASIQRPLPHVNELTSDLFDLILRLAANDDIEQGDTSIPLRLVAPSAVQSVSIVLQAVSDHLDWLLPISISSRYRFILQIIIQTFKCNELSTLRDPGTYDCLFPDEDFASWSRRATFVIETAKVESRSRIALSTTKLMVLLCSRTNTKKQGDKYSPHAGLQLRQSSHFWSEMDNDAVDIPSNIMARVFDFNFAERFLLPLSYKCALLLAASSLPSQMNKKPSSTSQGCESLPSLVATLCSVLDMLAKHEVLHDCIHIGWSIQIFALSVSYFVFGEDFHWRERESKTSTDWDFTSDHVWEHLSYELNRLYCSVWGKDWQMCSRSPVTTKKCIYYESIGRGSTGVAMLVLMPSFDVFISSLIEFSCGLNSPEASDGVKGFCQYIANIMFDRYAYVHQVCPPIKGYYEVDYPRQHELSLIISWIDTISSMFQEMVCARLFSGRNGNKRIGTADEALTTKALDDLITPVMRCLHKNIMRRLLLSTAPRPEINGDYSELVASGFVRLFKREEEKFLTKPSPAKTRKWNIYRKCLEAVFTVTAPDVLFACPSHPALTEHAAATLTDIWNLYGEWNLSHSISIMVAASLHVGACASSPKRDSSLVRQDELLLQTKQLYTNFSSCAKSCILSYLHSNSKSQSLDELRCNINYLVRFVKRELSLRGGTDIALEWWNEISFHALTLLKNHSSFHLK